MIQIKTLASGSKGNCYRVSDGVTPILLEVGISIKKIKQGLNYRLSEIEGCLVTHEHKDHCKSVDEIMKAGINCYMTKGTKKELNINNHRIQKITAKIRYEIGNWYMKPFKIEHDAAEPVGFLLWSKATGEKLIFLTDTFYSKYQFHKPNYIMIECNYSMDILNENIKNGRVPAAQKKRLLKTHMSLQTCKDFLKANDLSKVKEIWLLHLSDRNSDAELFKREIQELTGKPTYIAG